MDRAALARPAESLYHGLWSDTITAGPRARRLEMRVIPILIVGALALPAFAGSSSSEIVLPGSPEGVLDSSTRAGELDDAAGAVEGIADDPAAKDHNNQCDEPDGPPCEGGG
jgi:hypothetical protein